MPDPIGELKKEFRGVTKSVNDLGRNIAGQCKQLKGIEKTLDKHDKRITKTREGQLLATHGVEVLNREMRDAKKAIANPGTTPVALEDRTNGAILRKLLGRYKYWIAAISLLAVGFYLGSGGDEEKTLKFSSQVFQSLQEIGLKVEKIEQIKTEPIRVPVPVSVEYVSEETP